MASPCVKAVQEASKKDISERQAADILRNARKIALSRARLKQIDITEAIKEIQGELSKNFTAEFERRKRNALLQAMKNREKVDQIMARRPDAPGKGLEATMLGGEAKNKAGLQSGFSRIAAQTGLWVSRLFNNLAAHGVFEAFRDSAHPLDVLKELEALTDPTKTPGLTGNKEAMKIASVIDSVQEPLRHAINENGGWIDYLAGYTIAQTHDIFKMKALGREPGILGFLKSANKEKAFNEWWAREAPRWDTRKMLGTSAKTIDEIARSIFDGFWDEHHAREIEGELDESFKPYGSVAQRFSNSRVIHYKNAEAFYAHEVEFGRHGGKYAPAILGAIESRAKMLALLSHDGPGGKRNISKMLSMLEQRVREQPDTAARDKALKSLQDTGKFEREYDVMSGLIDIPVNMVLARAFQTARVMATVAHGGTMLVNSFGDVPISHNQMTASGASTLQAFGSRIEFLFNNSLVNAEGLHQLGVSSSAFLNELVRAGGRDIAMGDKLRTLQKKFYSAIGMTRWTEALRMAGAAEITDAYGRLADKPFADLPPDRARILDHAGIGPQEWDVMRKAVFKYTEGPMSGHVALSHENFYTIPDSEISKLVTAKGQTITPANISRMRTELESKYGAMVTDRVAAVASEPGGWEKWIATGGGRFQAGTAVGEIMRPLFMFKMFALSVPRRVAAQAGNIGPARAAFSYATLLAGMTVAGYLSMTVNNLLRGKTAPKWLNDDGTIKAATLAGAWEKAGGFGLYGSLVFNEYNNYGKSITDSLLGPLYSPLVSGVQTVRKTIVPTDTERTERQQNALGLEWWRMVEGNLPMANVFYLKPALDHAIFWNIREMISPGTLHRTERAAQRRGEDWYIRPSEVAAEDFGGRMGALLSRPKKAIESLAQ